MSETQSGKRRLPGVIELGAVILHQVCVIWRTAGQAGSQSADAANWSLCEGINTKRVSCGPVWGRLGWLHSHHEPQKPVSGTEELVSRWRTSQGSSGRRWPLSGRTRSASFLPSASWHFQLSAIYLAIYLNGAKACASWKSQYHHYQNSNHE